MHAVNCGIEACPPHLLRGALAPSVCKTSLERHSLKRVVHQSPCGVSLCSTMITCLDFLFDAVLSRNHQRSWRWRQCRYLELIVGLHARIKVQSFARGQGVYGARYSSEDFLTLGGCISCRKGSFKVNPCGGCACRSNVVGDIIKIIRKK